MTGINWVDASTLPLWEGPEFALAFSLGTRLGGTVFPKGGIFRVERGEREKLFLERIMTAPA